MNICIDILIYTFNYSIKYWCNTELMMMQIMNYDADSSQATVLRLEVNLVFS